MATTEKNGFHYGQWFPLKGMASCTFLFVEAIPSSGSFYMVWDMTPIEIIEKSIFWSSTPDHWVQQLKAVSLRFLFMNMKNDAQQVKIVTDKFTIRSKMSDVI